MKGAKSSQVFLDGIKACEVSAYDVGSDKYFALKIVFPNNAKRILYIGYTNLADTQDWDSAIKQHIMSANKGRRKK